jgi:hypothetical protein
MYRTLMAALFLCTIAFAGDSVWTEPAQPTTQDSITFHLFNEDECCCTQYHNVGVWGSDTTIMLGFEADSRPCAQCLCIVPGSWLELTSAPLAAGRYAIYKAESLYCPPGEECPAIAILPVRVGELTVTAPSATRDSRPTRNSVSIRHDRPVAAYTLRGERLGRNARAFGTAGVIVQLRGDNALLTPMPRNEQTKTIR